MAHAKSGIVAPLLRRFDHRLAGAHAPARGDERRGLRVAGADRGGQGVLGRQRQERHAEQRVGAGRVDLHIADPGLRRGQSEAQPRALAASDPAGLHHPHPLRPAVEAVERGEQFGRVFRDPQEPLAELLLLDRRSRAPAAPVDHLLVGEDRPVHRVPVDPALLALRQPGAQEIKEQLLLVAVIGRVAGGDLARPIEGEAHALQLGAHRGDVLRRPASRMHTPLARRVLRRQPERVPAHRVEHGMAARPLVAGDYIAKRVVPHVPHVDLAAGVGKHFKDVILRPRVAVRPVGDGEAAMCRPFRLPTRLGGAEIIAWRGLGRDLIHDRSYRRACRACKNGAPQPFPLWRRRHSAKWRGE